MKYLRFVLLILILLLLTACADQQGIVPTEPFDYERFQVTQEEVEAEHVKFGKEYCSATTKDDYALDEVIVIVYPFASHVSYTPDDFAEIGCIEVSVLAGEGKDHTKPDLMYLLKIPQTTKKGILDAIKRLEQRPDIYVAQPNYVYSVGN